MGSGGRVGDSGERRRNSLPTKTLHASSVASSMATGTPCVRPPVLARNLGTCWLNLAERLTFISCFHRWVALAYCQ